MRSKGHCLYCFHAPLDDNSRCSACGQVSRPSERVQYWTRRRKNRRLERVSKGLAILSLPVGFLVTQIGLRGAMMGRGWVFLFPLLFSIALWKTSENWTEHNPYFRARLVWTLSFGGLGALFLLADYRIGLGFIAIAVMSWALCELGERWKQRLRTSGGVSEFDDAATQIDSE